MQYQFYQQRITGTVEDLFFNLVNYYPVGAGVTALATGATYGYLSVHNQYKNLENKDTSAVRVGLRSLFKTTGAVVIHTPLWPITLPCFLYDCYNKTWEKSLI